VAEASKTSERPGGSAWPRDEFQSVFWSTKRAMAEAADVAYRKHGVRGGQQFILQCLWREDGLPPGEIAKRLELATPTVTKAATRMESSGLLTRRPDTRDRRLVRLYLTERGRTLERILDEEMANLSERALASLRPEQRADLIQWLTTIRQNLTK
jgi:MarR family transcriptional regulator, organic hydroperoxide resistance regulator